MKKILPRYGIDAIEIPRASVGGHAISASVARKAADSGDTETLLNNVPATTLRFMGLDYNFSG
jgi:citrate lyase synthetase